MSAGGYQVERDTFVAWMAQHGTTPHGWAHTVAGTHAREMMRQAARIQRLATAECNGDAWEHGRTVVCRKRHKAGADCGTCGQGDGTAGRVSRDELALERAEHRVRAYAADLGLDALCQRDPRGACVRLRVRGSHSHGVHVPVRP